MNNNIIEILGIVGFIVLCISLIVILCIEDC